MRKVDSSLKNMMLSLGLITIVAALILSGVYLLTSGLIAEAERKAQVEAISEVAPEFDNNPLDEVYYYKIEADANGSPVVEVYPARKGGILVGAAVKSVSKNGFGGDIVVMCGFDADGTVKDYKVLKHTETAGLGSKMQDWFRTEKVGQCVLGLNPAKDDVRVKKDGGRVDAITAATITSRAFLDALCEGFNAFKKMQEDEKEAQENE